MRYAGAMPSSQETSRRGGVLSGFHRTAGCLGALMLGSVAVSTAWGAVTNFFSPTVSYNFKDGNVDPVNSPKVSYVFADATSSPTVSYQYHEPSTLAPTVSYVFLDGGTNDLIGYVAPGENLFLSKPILYDGTPYQVAGITALTSPSIQSYADMLEPATYSQPPAYLADPDAGARPAVISIKPALNSAFLVRYFADGSWHICTNEFTRAWIYYLSLAEVQAHYRVSPGTLHKGVYSARPDYYADDLAFRDTEAFWFPTCYGKWLPGLGAGEQAKYHLSAFGVPVQNHTIFGLGSFFTKDFIPLDVDTKTLDLANRFADATIDIARILDFEKRKFQYIPENLVLPRQIIHKVGMAWNIYQSVSDIFMVEVLDTETLALMAYLDERASNQGDLDPQFKSALSGYVNNNSDVGGQIWLQFESTALSTAWDQVKDEWIMPNLAPRLWGAAAWLAAKLGHAGLFEVGPQYLGPVLLDSGQVLGVYGIIFQVTVDVAANPEGVYERRILSYYEAKNAQQWEKLGTNLAQVIDTAPGVEETQAAAYLLSEIIERQTYGDLCQNLVAATEASFAGNVAMGLGTLIDPNKARWIKGTAENWQYLNQRWNDVVRCMLGRTRRTATATQDTQAPAAHILSPSASGTLTTNQALVILSGTATDDVAVVSLSWSSSGGLSGTCTGSNVWQTGTIRLVPGTNVLTVTASDATGKTAEAILNAIYAVPDQQPPWVTIVSPATNGLFDTGSSNVSVSAQVGDDVGVVSVNWTNSRTGNGSCLLSKGYALATNIYLLAGDNPITLTARDASGKATNATLTIHRTLADTIPPSIAIYYPTTAAQFTVSTNVVVVCGAAFDAGGIASLTWSNSLGGSGTCSGSGLWSSSLLTLNEGDNLISAAATDFAGNTSVAATLLTYHASTPVGAVAVRLGPTDAETSGALWQIDQGSWHFGNEVVSGVSTGGHFVGFSQLFGYRTPPVQTTVVEANVTSVVSALYWNNTNSLRLAGAWTTNGFDLGVNAPTGFSYRIERTTNLSSWMPFTNFFSTNPAVRFQDPEASNFDRLFYRAVLPW